MPQVVIVPPLRIAPITPAAAVSAGVAPSCPGATPAAPAAAPPYRDRPSSSCGRSSSGRPSDWWALTPADAYSTRIHRAVGEIDTERGCRYLFGRSWCYSGRGKDCLNHLGGCMSWDGCAVSRIYNGRSYKPYTPGMEGCLDFSNFLYNLGIYNPGPISGSRARNFIRGFTCDPGVDVRGPVLLYRSLKGCSRQPSP